MTIMSDRGYMSQIAPFVMAESSNNNIVVGVYTGGSRGSRPPELLCNNSNHDSSLHPANQKVSYEDHIHHNANRNGS